MCLEKSPRSRYIYIYTGTPYDKLLVANVKYNRAVYAFACRYQHAQESGNSLSAATVKLGNYSKWNRTRDFIRNVPQPLDRLIGLGVWLGNLSLYSCLVGELFSL